VNAERTEAREATTMTRKHFEMLARTLGELLAREGWDVTPSEAHEAAKAFGDRLSGENPRFNHDRFVDAVMTAYDAQLEGRAA
jgi:hypothetical protein